MELMPTASPPVERFLYAQAAQRERADEEVEMRTQGVPCELCLTIIAVCTLSCVFDPICIAACVADADEVCVTCI